ncbi:MAG: PQQ-dependent sugar dehydrogenase [Akkermansiaceae bacterium]|nr:PQQ-dependent sugar dehydrogenase [Akkermansiaceae bacterium]
MMSFFPSARSLCRTALALGAAILPARADLTERWSFNDNPGAVAAGSVAADSISGKPATIQGQGAAYDGAALVLPGSTNGNEPESIVSAYIDLPNGILSSRTDATVEIWATPLGSRQWQRIFDFGNMEGAGDGAGETGEWTGTLTTAPGAGIRASDEFALTFNVNNDLNSQRLYGRLNYNGPGQVNLYSEIANATTAGQRYHYVVTFEDGVGAAGGGRETWFRDGVQIASLDVPFHLSDLDDVNNWIGRSQFTNDWLSYASFDEVRLYDHVLGISEITANLAAGPDLLVDPPDPVDPPVPDHLWVFNDGADSEVEAGTAFADSIGGMIATLRGNGGTLSQTALQLPGTTTGNQSAAGISAYLDLPNGILSAQPSITFEAWAAPLSSKNWQRLFDFGRCVTTSGNGAVPGEILDGPSAPGNTAGYDNLSLTFNNAGNLNSQQLEGQNDGGAPQYTFSNAATTPGTMYHYVFVVEDTATGCQARWYRDGVLQNSDDFPFHTSDIEDVNNWIGRSMYSGDSNSNMALDELRIYRRAITAAEALASYQAGPDPTIGPPEPLPPVPVPIHRWSFNEPDGSVSPGTVYNDVATGEPASLLGNGAAISGNALVLPGSTNSNQAAGTISAYLSLRDGIVSGHPSLSVESWITPLSSLYWQRVFDFGNSTVTVNSTNPGEIIDGAAAPGYFEASDNLFLSLNVNNTLGTHRFAAKLNGGGETGQNYDLSGITGSGSEYHFVLTVQDGAGSYGSTGCQAKWFRDGVVRGSIDLNFRLTELQDFNNWIGRSNWSADSGSHIAINELRFHDRALASAEITASYQAGPDAVFAPPVAHDDGVTLHDGQKALVDVLGNDEGAPIASTLEILTGPSSGTASLKNGGILYQHAGGTTTDSFTYRVGNASGATADGNVTINVSGNLRIDNAALAMPTEPPATSWQLVDALPGLTFSRPICLTPVPGDAKQLYVCEQGGVIRRVADVTSPAPATNVFLDLTTLGVGFNVGPLLAGQPENGLLGLAFHPDYGTNGYFYVAYTVNQAGNYFQRVSRFSRDAGDATIADPASEVVLLHIDDFGLNHNGGDLHFGPEDGYLYYGTGDGENSGNGQLRSQRIDDDFYSGIFRMDVDKSPGSLPPSPHASIPTDNGVARFNVPPDNPFVHTSLGGTWDGMFNGVDYSGSLASVRTEFWAVGIRHAWRMSFDPLTGDLWEGDVGQDLYEEINRIEKGGNYGWAYREGAHDFTGERGSAPTGFTSTDPVYEYVHTGVAGGDAAFKGNSVVGGYVYRGTRYPSLAGAYVFSDSVSGHVWQMDTGSGAATRLTGLPGAYGVISSQGVDPSNQDLLFCAYLAGKIMRLATSDSGGGGFPATLSETGLFADLTDLSPSPGLLPYEPNLRFWSDHADKTRWFAIPDSVGRMTYQREGLWDYPDGTVWVKHFDLDMSRGNPATAKRIETRVLVKKSDGGAYGVSYRWNEEQTEAYLVEDAGVEFDLQIDDHGTPHTQRWSIPGRTSCLTCHGDNALSFHTRQLNKTASIHGFTGNQIELLSNYGYLANTPDPVDALGFHVRADETQYPLERRVRSYFDVNCAYCHQDGGSVGGFWDGRESLTLEQTGLIMGVATQAGNDPANRYIVPGDTLHSIVLQRMAGTNGFTRMPPLATAEIDEESVQLVSDWINDVLPYRPLYDQWRDTFFTPGDPQGARDIDADGDGLTNYQEFLLGSSPLSGAGFWQAQVSPGGGNPTIGFLRKAYRHYKLESSGDLGEWNLWDLPDLEDNYVETDTWTEIPFIPPSEGGMFFRFQVSEP